MWQCYGMKEKKDLVNEWELRHCGLQFGQFWFRNGMQYIALHTETEWMDWWIIRNRIFIWINRSRRMYTRAKPVSRLSFHVVMNAVTLKTLLINVFRVCCERFQNVLWTFLSVLSTFLAVFRTFCECFQNFSDRFVNIFRTFCQHFINISELLVNVLRFVNVW
jgi:hypothetical protein